MTHPWAPFLPLNTSLMANTAHNDTSKEGGNLGLIPLSDYRIITLTGPDALAFLQGQCTCDFGVFAQEQWLRGAHCNPKGRMISSFTAAQLAPEVIGLRVHHSIATQTIEAFKKYLVFSKAQCELSEYLAVGLTQASVAALAVVLRPEPSLTPEQPLTPEPARAPEPPINLAQLVTRTSTYGLLLTGHHMAELWLTPEQLRALIDHLIQQNIAQPLLAPALWQHMMIEQGIAEVTELTTQRFLPQAFNYDAIGAVSFKKGCYTGQEIIARMHYKGQSKQRLHLLRSHDANLSLGQPLLNTAGKAVGEVINASGHLILACSSAYLGDEPLHVKSANNAPLSAVALPYSLVQ
ncbi:CAF17-like 4Fe-4S cluster assembly/insertion protein YgfZ [Marinagarivorans algicola]|uniref:CAF17-like 4Fe-4S cluster assembly/insertion protein YgfZ n=1 Tax=Marinagarivorans algicola TaxID=1513270 RepID=UPI003735DDFD